MLKLTLSSPQFRSNWFFQRDFAGQILFLLPARIRHYLCWTHGMSPCIRSQDQYSKYMSTQIFSYNLIIALTWFLSVMAVQNSLKCNRIIENPHLIAGQILTAKSRYPVSLSARLMMSVISTSVGLAPARLMALFRIKFSKTFINFQSLGKGLGIFEWAWQIIVKFESRSVLSIDKP